MNADQFFRSGITETYTPTREKAHNGHRSRSTGGVTAKQLGTMVFPPIKWIVPGLIPQGATILAGLPKLGKSWMALDISLAVARGSYCLGSYECERGDVLYLAFEDNLRRLQEREAKVTPPGCRDPWPENLLFYPQSEFPRADEGGLDAIREWLSKTPNARLIVVDVLEWFRSGRSERQSHYSADYEAIRGLQELAGQFSVGVLIIHHVRKGAGDADKFEKVSGTLGLSGSADATIILDRSGAGITLYGRGRDMPEFELAVSFDKTSCRWTVQGEASEVRRSDERGTILDALEESGDPMSPSDIAAVTGMKSVNVRRLLLRMVKAGEVRKEGRGLYVREGRIRDDDEG